MASTCILNIHRSTGRRHERRHRRRSLHQRPVLERRERRWDWKPIRSDSRTRETGRRCSSRRSSSIRTNRTGCSPAGCRCGERTMRRRRTRRRAGRRGRDQAERRQRISAIAVAKGNQQRHLGRPQRRPGVQDGERAGGGADLAACRSAPGRARSSPGRYCTRITIDPKNAQIVYVTFGGYVSGNVWKTTDGGSTWTELGASLPEAPVRALAVHPRKPTSSTSGPRSACSRAKMPARPGRRRTKDRRTARSTISSGWARRWFPRRTGAECS